MAETKINTTYFAKPPADGGNNPASVFSLRASIAHMDLLGDIDRMNKVPQGVTILGHRSTFNDMDTNGAPTLTLSAYVHSPSGAQADIPLFTDSTVPRTGGSIDSHVGPTDAAACGIGATERASIGTEVTAPDAEVRLETTAPAATAVATARYSIELEYQRIFDSSE